MITRKFILVAIPILISACSKTAPVSSIVLHEENAILGGYELTKTLSQDSCPFVHETYNFDSLLGQIKSQLDSKIKGEDECTAPQRALLQNLSVVNDYYLETRDTNKYFVGQQVYQPYLLDLQAQLTSLRNQGQENSYEAMYLASNIATAQQKIVEYQYQQALSSPESERNQKRIFKANLFNHLNSILVTANQMPAKCVNQIGGWDQLMPSILGLAAIGTGTSIFAHQASIGSGLFVAANLASLLQNRNAKTAFQKIINLNNQKALACTYFSLQHSTCEIRRGLKLAKDNKEKMTAIFSGKSSNDDHPEWSKHLKMISKLDELLPVLESIATQGSSLSLDTDSVAEYFASLQLNPSSLPEAPTTGSDDEKTKWLSIVNKAGVQVRNRDNFGKPLTLDEKVSNAVTSISNAKNTITLITQTLKENKSFEALKHSLNARNPGIKNVTKEMADFIKSQIELVNPTERGLLQMSALLLERLNAFVSVEMKKDESIKAYLDRLATTGTELFESISLGSVAQISKQEVLALGGKSFERLQNTFTSIENKFISSDLANSNAYENSFLNYKQQRLLFYQLANIYSDMNGSGATLRDSEIDVAFSSFEKGFSDELLEMLDYSINNQSSRAPELKDATAPHLCALLNQFMKSNDSYKARSLLETCRGKFKALQIKTLFYESSEKIDYEDSCTYDNYYRKNKNMQSLDFIKRSL